MNEWTCGHCDKTYAGEKLSLECEAWLLDKIFGSIEPGPDPVCDEDDDL